MKHKLLLILLTFISASVFGQSWQDGANGVQFRYVGDKREIRQLIKSPQPPYGVTDSLAKLESFINKKDFLSTGLIDHAALSATIGGTTFNISAGHGVVANFDNHFYPSIKRVNITAKTGITPQFLTTAITSYVAIDSNDNVVQSASPFTDVQSRDLIILGAIVHSNLTNINAVNNIAKPVISNTNQLHDLYEAVGALNTAGNKYTANGANLNIDKSAGNLFKLGVNFINDWKSPSKLTIALQTAATFRYRTQTGTEFADRTTIDPGFYDVAGTRTAIPGSLNQFTIQRITLFQSGLTRIQYGQNVYANKSEAMAAISTESFTTETNIAENGIFRAYLVVRGNATTLNDLAQAEFVEVGKFGSPIGNAGGAVTSANIIAALGYTPENVANKSINLTSPDNTKYPSTLAVTTGLSLKENSANKQNSLTVDGSGTKFPTVDAVNGSLSGKANLVSGKVPLNELIISPYTLKIITDDLFTFGKDGVIAFENDDKFYLVGGWNGSQSPKTDNEQWVSEDNGLTWVQISDAPFTGRHTVATETANGKTYIVGGDIYNLEYDSQYAKDSWYFDGGSWTQIATDSGIGNRILSELVYHSGAFYLIGGQVSDNPADGLYNNVLKSTDDCASFTNIGTTPFAGGNLWGASASFNGKIWKVCGGVYSEVLSERTYPKEIYSSTDGVTWTLEGTFPGVGRSYAQLSVVGDEMFISHGYNHLEGGNLSDAWVTKDGVNWTEVKNNDISRHAHSAWVYDNTLYWTSGTTNSVLTPIVHDVVSLTKQINLDEYVINTPITPSVLPFSNTIAKRDEKGQIEAFYFRSTNNTNLSTPPQFLTGHTGGDGYMYEFNQSAVRSFLGYSDMAITANWDDMVNKPDIDRILGVGNTTTKTLTVGRFQWGSGTYPGTGISTIYNDTELGTILIAKTGTSFDFSLASSIDGGNIFQVPTGTKNLHVIGNLSATSYSGGATLTGIPTSTTPTAGDNSTRIATTAWVQNALKGGGTTPTISVTGAGTGATININGNNVDGVITITAGTSPSAMQIQVTFSGGFAYPTQVTPVVSPFSSPASTLGYYLSALGNNTFTISQNAAATGGGTYNYTYHAGGF